MTLDLNKFTGLDKSFLPHYQFEQPLEFHSLVNHFMKYYYDEDKEPELYITNMRNAVRFANKSIMFEKFGIPSDFEGDERFTKSFNDISKSFDSLEVHDGNVTYHDDLQKSVGGKPYESKNTLYEKIFLKAYRSYK